MGPIPSGEVLRVESLVPLDLTANALAQALRVSAARIKHRARAVRIQRFEPAT